MTDAQKIELRQRAQRILRAPIPQCVREGSANRAAQYRDGAAVVSGFSMRGTNAAKAWAAIERLEGLQRGAQ